jgi:hypothetical protein
MRAESAATGPEVALLDRFAPHPDASEVHRAGVAAPPEAVYRALWTVDFARSPVVAGLLALRALPGWIRSRGTGPRGRELTLNRILELGFGRLAEEPDREIVLGVSGRFWHPTGNLEPFRPEDFSRPVPPGMARGVWSFRVVPRADGGTLLSTETRVTCGDAASRFRFRLYWLAVRPFSGLIRIAMLRSVRRAAEAGEARAG